MIDYVRCPFCNYDRVRPTNEEIEQCINNQHKTLINHLFARCSLCGKAWKYKEVWERIFKMVDIQEIEEE